MTAILRRAAALVLVTLASTPAAGVAAPPVDTGPTDIFTAVVVTRAPQQQGAQAPLYRVRVDEVIKGDQAPNAMATVVRSTAFARCDGARLEPSTRPFLFQLTADGAALVATECGDVQPATPPLLREIRQQVQAQEEQQNPPPPPPELEPAVFRDLPADEPRPFARAAAPGLAIVIIGVLGLLLTGRLTGRRP